MWPLVKKNTYFFASYTIPFLGMWSLYWFLNKESLELIHILLQCAWMWILVMGSISVSEQYEAKNRGIEFLKTLPVTEAEIVYSRFLLVLLAVFLIWGFNFFYFSLFRPMPQKLYLGRILVSLSGNICLLLAGAVYISIFKFGISWVFKLFWGLAVLMFFSPIVVKEFILPGSGFSIRSMIETITGVHWSLWVAVSVVCLGLYSGLMSLAVKILKEKRG